ncbi:hypothetical protein GCM10009433_21910 [Psychroflexus lacisalsi]|uniref:Uncharacterized protein n=1 Tax=Psychroflexus lacisalsi TaxID=503928 RepID=A0ABN1KCM1_9FLAO
MLYIKLKNMAKIYSKEVLNSTSKPMRPSAKTIKSILDFSKAMTVVQYRNLQFENIQN